MEHIKKYKLTFIGLLISTATLMYSLINDLDLFEIFLNNVHKMEAYEIDEFIIPIFIFGLFTLLDMLKWQKEHKIENEKIKIYEAMVASTHHVLNNFLNQMQLFKMTADDTPDFDPSILALYDQIMKDTTEQIDALSSITNIDEKSIHKSVAPQQSKQSGNNRGQTTINTI